MFGKYLNHTSWDGVSYSTIPGLNVTSYTTGNKIISLPAVANGFVYIGSEDNNLYQLNASNISQKITNLTTGNAIESSPAVANSYVYIGSGDNYLYQLNATNISQKIANFSNGFTIESSPAVANSYLYIGSGDFNIYQLNASNVSQKIANFSTGAIVYTSPAFANGYVYIGTQNNLFQLNASNVSQKIANFSTDTIASSPAVANGSVYFGTNLGYIYQLNASNVSQKIANFTAGDSVTSSPAVANGYVYVGSFDRYIYQLNASNISQEISNFSTGNFVESSPAVANGYVYIGSDDNKVYQFNASNISQKIANFITGGSVTSSPAVANGYVYIGSDDGNIYQLNASNISLQSIDLIPPMVNLTSPGNAFYSNNRTNYFVANFTDNVALKNATVFIWNSTNSLINSTQYVNITGIMNSTNISIIVPYDGIFYWNYYACDNSNKCGFNNTNYTLTVDTTYPQIILISPDNATNWTSSSTVTFAFNVSDAGIANCSLIINNAIDQTNAPITTNTPQYFTRVTSNTIYTWSINCTDNAGNMNYSETRKLTVNYTSSDNSGDTSSSSSSTSFWSNTQTISNKQFTDGYTQPLPKKYRIQFALNNTFHYIGVIDLETNYATINLSSTPIQTTMYIGDEKKFDLTGDSYYDIYVKLNSISNFKANITIRKINEKISSSSSTPLANLSSSSSNSSTNETNPYIIDDNANKLNTQTIIIISVSIIIIIIIIILAIYFVTKHKKNNVKHQAKIKVFEF